ncbi:MAG: GNAT family N-acetyltransferase [Acidimicrobiales bacterium]
MAELIDLLGEPAWDSALSGLDGELFQSRRWLGALNSAFGLEFEASIERNGAGAIVGGVPFCRIDDIRGSRIATLPFSDFVIPMVEDESQWQKLVEPMLDYGLPVSVQTAADSIVALDPRFEPAGSTVRHSIALDDDIDSLVARFSQLPRRFLRKADKAGLRFEMATGRDDLRAFYDLHLGVRKYKHKLLCQPYSLFEAIWENFIADGCGGVMLGFDGDQAVGGCLVLEAGDTLYYKFSASHPDYRQLGVSHAAVVESMKYGLARGLSHLDLGRSDIDQPGLIDFKRRFGATATELGRFVWAPEHYCPRADESGALLGRLTELFVDSQVPDEMTERAGDLLYRYFA